MMDQPNSMNIKIEISEDFSDSKYLENHSFSGFHKQFCLYYTLYVKTHILYMAGIFLKKAQSTNLRL